MQTGTNRICLPRAWSRLVAVAGLCVSVGLPALGLAATVSNSAEHSVAASELRPLVVRAYSVKGDPLLTNSAFTAALACGLGTNLGLADILHAAGELQRGYRSAGYTNVTLTLGQPEMTNGVVTLHVFRGAVSQIVLDGKRLGPTELERLAQASRATHTLTASRAGAGTAGSKSGSPTNAAPGFRVSAYAIHGDTLLKTETLEKLLVPYTGTNVTVNDIIKAGTGLQMEYRNRGFPTVKVTIPPQRLDTNGIVKVQVVEGRLAEINVFNNRYFSANNIRRVLPSLHTNTILLEPVFQAELDRANANQDRQIYPEIGPGPTEGTSTLDLKVKDRLPLHAKADFNNQNSPGTPDLRLNTSAVYNNLWQYEHSLGVQYAFSPQEYKTGDQWNFYDQPLVANYGAFYRLPLGNPEPIAQAIATSAGSFGYDEATRKFHLPPPSGQPELNLYASRSTIESDLSSGKTLDDTGTNILRQIDVQQDLTINETAGFRFTLPLPATTQLQSGLSFGPDYKHYGLTSQKTNIFTLTSIIPDPYTGSTVPRTNISVQTNASGVPLTVRDLNYLPVTLRYNATLRDPLGVTGFGLGLSVNSWYSGSRQDLDQITGSTNSSGHWVILNPTLSRDFVFSKNWTLSLNASGQWANEPLISNEQFGLGGVGSIRGYHEGEVFGNDGWWVTAEQKTPPYIVGKVYGNSFLSVRGSVFTGYGQVFPLGPHQDLWGAGFGGAASIGPNWEARLLCSWPFISTPNTKAGQPRFDFSLSAQF